MWVSGLSARCLLALSLSTFWVLPGFASDTTQHCNKRVFSEAAYVICTFDPTNDDIRLFHAGEDEKPFRHFSKLEAALKDKSETLIFAMNAGMFDRSRNPIGLYVERAVEKKKVNRNDGPGNFHLMPNGVFWIWKEDGYRVAHVATTEDFVAKATKDVIDFATQSGPMLVIDGQLHPKFLADSTSRKRRNGVGVTEAGDVIFAISDTPVTFYEFATMFKEQLKTPNALFLDGSISRIFAPDIERRDYGVPMGPIVGVVALRADEQK